MKGSYNIKSLLEIIFKVTKKNAKILADQYLLKDVSIISKWRNNVVLPRNYDIYKIVQFVNNEATTSQKGIIRNNIEELLIKAPIQSNLRDIILNSEDFGEFLKEALSVSISISDDNESVICSEKEENVKNIVKKAPEAMSNESYTGTVELDFVVPEGGNVNLQNLSFGSGIEFKGRLNLAPRKKILHVANMFKSRSVLGVLVLGVFVAMAFTFNNLPKKEDIQVFTAKNDEVLNTPCVTEQSSEVASDVLPTSIATAIPSPVSTICYTPIPEKKDKNLSAGEQGGRDKQNTYNKTNNVNKSVTNNVTNNVTTNINISGKNQTTIIGDNNAVGFEYD